MANNTGILSKEEILEKFEGALHGEIESIYKAMSQYAQQQERVRSIAFNRWVSENGYEFLMWGGDKPSGWHKDGNYGLPPITDEQLYEIFSQTNQ